ncbi:MAG: SDR family NAD(P)-dependent oxidoreductase [Acidobacteriota bacterium]
MPILEGTRILVTGASRGIGRAIALACAERGASVAINYLSSEADAGRVAEEIRSRGGLASIHRFDVADARQVAAAIEALEAGGGVHALVNNAAINLPDLLVSASEERIQRQLAVNVLGPILCARAVLPGMLGRRRGVILNVGSVAAAHPVRGQAVYAAGKGALESFTAALAVEYGRKGIRAVCLRAGAVDTAMIAAARELAGAEIEARIPLRRLGKPEEVAAFAAFLLSDEARYVTGSTHSVDGGYATS